MQALWASQAVFITILSSVIIETNNSEDGANAPSFF